MPLWHLTVTEGAKPLPHFSCASSPERDFRRRQTRQKGLMTMSPCRDRKSAPPRGKAVFAAISSVIARGQSMQINGVAHTFITAGNFTTARAFYGQLLPFMGLTIGADTADTRHTDRWWLRGRYAERLVVSRSAH